MKEILAEYKAARTLKEQTQAQAKAAMEAFKVAEKKLAEHLVDQGLRNTTDEEGRQFILRPAFWYSKGKAMTEKVLSWLELRGQDPEQYWEPALRTKRLTEFLRELYDKEGKAPLPDSEHGVPQFFALDTTPTISVRGWRDDDGEED